MCSKSPINQATSKAMLTQMISIIARRMEYDQVQRLSLIYICYCNEKRRKWLYCLCSTCNLWQENQVSTSSGASEPAASSASLKTEEITVSDQSANEITLNEALKHIKDTPLASVEELHNLAGGADIKVCHFYWSLSTIHFES